MDNRFKINDNFDVIANGFPGLRNGAKGYEIGEKMAVFTGKDRSYTIVNMETGKMRTFVSENGSLLVEEKDIDIGAITSEFEHYGNAYTKTVCYYFGRYSNFKGGYCAILWTLYPDGRYFADEDGFGAENNQEENVYCIINRDLEIVVPFKPMSDVKSELQKLAGKTGTTAKD